MPTLSVNVTENHIYKGKPCDNTKCAIALAVTDALKSLTDVHVDYVRVTWTTCRLDYSGATIRLYTYEHPYDEGKVHVGYSSIGSPNHPSFDERTSKKISNFIKAYDDYFEYNPTTGSYEFTRIRPSQCEPFTFNMEFGENAYV